MRHRVSRVAALFLLAATLAGCDKCADNFLVDPFATKPASCHGEPLPK